ncbi:DUF692 domain-containing protein [Variovorax sp. dw_308]|uniref:MNIO family bufferin maturase n=1 Tax=Variovorax sp. dw_308 TaxID=2721546 RepID=UPI001C4795D5|nr:DUF692 domain-containing protein [Variovorax sp. dw_308]
MRPGAEARAGAGLKPAHYRSILEEWPDVGFFEVHAENYMGAGGPPHRYLSAIRERYPLSVHGVGLSIGGGRALDKAHLARLRLLIDRYAPALFSEHLAWSTHEAGFLNDLLPLPYTAASLACVVDHLDQVQEALRRSILLENPSTYLSFAESTYSEPQFLCEVVRRAGCGLLLDVNNVYVSSVNQGWNPYAYIEECPLDRVGQVHLAGHSSNLEEESGRRLLIDSHDRFVADDVWQLYVHVLRQIGRVPTLIEWDAKLPDWQTLRSQAALAESLMKLYASPRDAGVVASAMTGAAVFPSRTNASIEAMAQPAGRRQAYG